MTNNLITRLKEHYDNRGKAKTFTGKYYCYYLVYYEWHQYVWNAIAREKEIKQMRRELKDKLIAEFNPDWKFLNIEFCGEWPPNVEGRLLDKKDGTGSFGMTKGDGTDSFGMTKGDETDSFGMTKGDETGSFGMTKGDGTGSFGMTKGDETDSFGMTKGDGKKILVTGTAGFIGFHLANRLLQRGDEVVGLDNINDYYDTRLKFDRLKEAGIQKEDIGWNHYAQSTKYPNYQFIRLDLEDKENVTAVYKRHNFDVVINLAAQAGVRYSMTNPEAYIQSNIVGFLNILEGCRHHHVKHLVYASSSSVYGLNENMPFSTSDNVDHPVSLYAATKKSNELMAHSYSHLYSLPTTGLRFFTVYGPWGRPDMALFLFTKAMLEDQPIEVFNHGNMVRDFTYVDDIVEGIVRVADNPPAGNKNWSGKAPDPACSKAPYKIYNIGNNNPVRLMDFIEAIENSLGLEAQKNLLPLQPGDVPETYADVQDLVEDLGYKPEMEITDGINFFMQWYKKYYQVKDLEKKSGVDEIVKKVYAVQVNSAIVKNTSELNDKLIIETYELLQAAIQNWVPQLNEKAVCIRLVDFTAWHLWFVEKLKDGSLRFKEAPLDYPSNSYYRINPNEKYESPDEFIMPVALFNILTQYFEFILFDDKYKTMTNISTPVKV